MINYIGKILRIKNTGSTCYDIALVEWERETFTEYSTHIKNDRGLDSGHYFNSLEDAEKDFNIRN